MEDSHNLADRDMAWTSHIVDIVYSDTSAEKTEIVSKVRKIILVKYSDTYN